MNKRTISVLTKPAPSGGISTPKTEGCFLCAQNHTPNAVTVKALKEAQDIMSGKKKTKTYHSAEELLSDLKA